MKSVDNLTQTSEADKVIIQAIIAQIKTGHTQEALHTIKGIDKTTLDKPVINRMFENESILKAAIEKDALEIFNTLLEKNCEFSAVLGTIENREKMVTIRMPDAFTLWLHRMWELQTDNISDDMISIGKTLLELRLKVLKDDHIKLFSEMCVNHRRVYEKSIPEIFSRLLGEQEYVKLLFHSTLNYPIFTFADSKVFEGFLKMLVISGGILSMDQMFICRLALYAKDLTSKEISDYLDILSKRISAKETKFFLKSEIEKLFTSQANSMMDDFPEKEYWRLFVDGRKQAFEEEHGWQGYEQREQGCIQNMYEAFVEVRKDLETEPLTYEMTDKIHEIATGHFKTKSLVSFRDDLTRNGMVAFGALSYQGFLEITAAPYNTWFQLKKLDNKPLAFEADFSRGIYKNKEQIIAKIKEIIEDYHRDFTMSGNDRIKQLQCIIKLASDYARFHPYRDGNNRTAMCILNRELQKNGFPLTILENPNELEGHSQAELLMKVCEGMNNFLLIKAGAPYPGSKNTDELISENNEPPPIQLIEPKAKKNLDEHISVCQRLRFPT